VAPKNKKPFAPTIRAIAGSGDLALAASPQNTVRRNSASLGTDAATDNYGKVDNKLAPTLEVLDDPVGGGLNQIRNLEAPKAFVQDKPVPGDAPNPANPVGTIPEVGVFDKANINPGWEEVDREGNPVTPETVKETYDEAGIDLQGNTTTNAPAGSAQNPLGSEVPLSADDVDFIKKSQEAQDLQFYEDHTAILGPEGPTAPWVADPPAPVAQAPTAADVQRGVNIGLYKAAAVKAILSGNGSQFELPLPPAPTGLGLTRDGRGLFNISLESLIQLGLVDPATNSLVPGAAAKIALAADYNMALQMSYAFQTQKLGQSGELFTAQLGQAAYKARSETLYWFDYYTRKDVAQTLAEVVEQSQGFQKSFALWQNELKIEAMWEASAISAEADTYIEYWRNAGELHNDEVMEGLESFNRVYEMQQKGTDQRKTDAHQAQLDTIMMGVKSALENKGVELAIEHQKDADLEVQAADYDNKLNYLARLQEQLTSELPQEITADYIEKTLPQLLQARAKQITDVLQMEPGQMQLEALYDLQNKFKRFVIPAELLWDKQTQSFIDRPNGGFFDRTDALNTYLHKIAPTMVNLDNVAAGIKLLQGYRNDAFQKKGIEDAAALAKAAAIQRGDFTAAEEADTALVLAQAQATMAQSKQFAIELYIKVLESPLALAMAQRTGTLGALENMLGVKFNLPDSFGNLQDGRLPTPEEWGHPATTDVMRAMWKLDWQDANYGKTDSEFFSMLNQQGVSGLYETTEVRKL
jgi:hypothetical protein